MSKLKVDEIRSADRSVSDSANIFLHDSGHIGVGSTTPNLMGINSNLGLTLSAGTSGNVSPYYEIQGSRTSNNARFGGIIGFHQANRVAGILFNRADNDAHGQIEFETEGGSGATVRMTIDQDGKVGIGTKFPTADVEIRGSGNTTLGANGNLFVADGGTASQAADEGGQIAFGAWLNGDPSVPYQMAAIKGVTESSTTNANTGALIFGTRDQSSGTIERMRIGGTGSLNGTATGTPWELSGYNGHLYLKNNVDVNASGGEVFATDKSGNHTQISPHNFSLIPDGPSEELAWSYYSERNKSTEDGNDPSAPTKKINVDMARVIRLVEQLSGETLIYTSED